jgi:hypothetical protein
LIKTLIQSILTIILISSSFSIVGVPYYFVIPYLITFNVFLFISLRYSDKTLKFWKNRDGEIFVSLGWHAFVYYLMATVGRIIVLIIVTAFRLDISNILNIELEGMISPIYYNFSIIVIITIFFDFMLMAGKGLMRGLDIRMLKHYKLIVSGKEKVDLKE